MMEPWEIEEILRREKERQVDNRPALEAPPPPHPAPKEKAPDEGGQGGTVIIIPI